MDGDKDGKREFNKLAGWCAQCTVSVEVGLGWSRAVPPQGCDWRAESIKQIERDLILAPAAVLSTEQGFSFLSSRGKLFNELRTQITAAIAPRLELPAQEASTCRLS
jgi:hypothetical protein